MIPRAGRTNTRVRRVKQLSSPGTNQWNEDLIREICYPQDADAILKIKLPSHISEDFPAWHFERNGIFSVKSAYKLAYNLNYGVRWFAGSSEARNNSRSIWKNVWHAPVPTKVRVFGWRAARDNLANTRNKYRRTLETISTCKVCGMTEENSYHATVECTKAKALRDQMRQHWDLPPESSFQYTGRDWLLVLLDRCNKIQSACILLLLWRAWHLRCNVIYDDGKETISNSVNFLLSYASTLWEPIQDKADEKGKYVSLMNNANCIYLSDVSRNVSTEKAIWSL
jgi:hypothetical protein